MKIAVLIDTSDLFHRVSRKYSRKINYAAAMELFQRRGSVVLACAYGIQRGNEASGFISCLQRAGFETYFRYPEIIRCGDRELKRSNSDCALTVAAMSPVVDEIILGTGSNNFVPLVHFLQKARIKVSVFGCSMGKELRNSASEIIEINEGMLE